MDSPPYGGTPEHLKYPPQWTTLGQATSTTDPIWYPEKAVEELRARAEKAESELAAEREKVRVLREENTWQDKTTAPIERTRVLATHLGVYQPCVGSIHDSRFYPDGQYGAEPFTHWMPLPTFAAMKEDGK